MPSLSAYLSCLLKIHSKPSICENLLQKNSPPFCLSHQFLQLASRATFLKITQVLVSVFEKIFLMANKMPFGEGASVNRPPLFCGVNYQFWKVRMKIFMHSTDKGIWESIENVPFIPQVKRDEVLIDKPSSEWTEAESKRAKFDWIAKNIITFALRCDEFFRVS